MGNVCFGKMNLRKNFGENPLQSSTVNRANHYVFIKHRNDRLSLIIKFKPKIFDQTKIFDRPSRFTDS